MARVLIIDDDASLLDVLTLALEDAGHTVLRASDGKAGYALARDAEVIVSDVNMPGLDGFSLVRKLRAEGVTTPIMLLTSRDGEIDEALGLDLGADDYCEKPFRSRALMARIAALARRSGPGAGTERSEDRLSAGEMMIDRLRQQAFWRGTIVPMTMTELRILEDLVRRPGVVRSRDQILDHIHDDGTQVAPRLIDTYVRRIRRKIEALDPAFDRIETVIGAGYRWR